VALAVRVITEDAPFRRGNNLRTRPGAGVPTARSRGASTLIAGHDRYRRCGQHGAVRGGQNVSAPIFG
jgi:hypothetical protein